MLELLDANRRCFVVTLRNSEIRVADSRAAWTSATRYGPFTVADIARQLALVQAPEPWGQSKRMRGAIEWNSQLQIRLNFPRRRYTRGLIGQTGRGQMLQMFQGDQPGRSPPLDPNEIVSTRDVHLHYSVQSQPNPPHNSSADAFYPQPVLRLNSVYVQVLPSEISSRRNCLRLSGQITSRMPGRTTKRVGRNHSHTHA